MNKEGAGLEIVPLNHPVMWGEKTAHLFIFIEMTRTSSGNLFIILNNILLLVDFLRINLATKNLVYILLCTDGMQPPDTCQALTFLTDS